MCFKTENMRFKMAFSLKNPVRKHGVLHCLLDRCQSVSCLLKIHVSIAFLEKTYSF